MNKNLDNELPHMGGKENAIENEKEQTSYPSVVSNKDSPSSPPRSQSIATGGMDELKRSNHHATSASSTVEMTTSDGDSKISTKTGANTDDIESAQSSAVAGTAGEAMRGADQSSASPRHAQSITKGLMEMFSAKSIATGEVYEEDVDEEGGEADSLDSYDDSHMGHIKSYVTHDVAFMGDVYAPSEGDSSSLFRDQNLDDMLPPLPGDLERGQEDEGRRVAAVVVPTSSQKKPPKSSTRDSQRIKQLAMAYERHSSRHNNANNDNNRSSSSKSQQSSPSSRSPEANRMLLITQRAEEVQRLYSKKQLREIEDERMHDLMLRIFWYCMFTIAAVVAIVAIVLSATR